MSAPQAEVVLVIDTRQQLMLFIGTSDISRTNLSLSHILFAMALSSLLRY
jgi:hypothetical protein